MQTYLQTTYGHAYANIIHHADAPDTCFLATEIASGQSVFLKTFNVAATANKRRLFANEVRFLSMLDGAPYICALRHSSFNEQQRVGLIVQECADHRHRSLVAIANETVGMDAAQYVELVRVLFLKMLDVLRDLQTRGVVHADLKPDNILYDVASRSIKLVDLEFATLAGETQSVRGSVPYVDYALMAPRAAAVVYHPANDLWSLAISMYRMMFTGVPCDPAFDDSLPASSRFRQQLMHWQKTAEGRFVFGPHSAAWDPTLTRCVLAIERCLTPTYEDRPTLDQVAAMLA